MASYTPNYNLKKPATTDNVAIADLNGNMDTVDTQLKTLSDQISTVTKSSDTIANIESWLVTISGSMADNQFKNVKFVVSTASGVFKASTTYIGTLKRFASGYYCVDLQSSLDGEAIQGRYHNTWQWTSLSDNLGNKANRNYVTWGTSVSCELAGNVGLLLVNNDLRVQIWLPGDGISIWTSYSDNGVSKGILKAVSGNSITFSASSADGNTFTITKNGSTITVTKSSNGTMLLIG